ncbi:MAG: DNA repair protein RadC [Alphaproteobacteria bacterium]|jgi:DNA repair protein RadC|nr:DNA repair protein RadC [Alphaproteobacteria bacterium]
MEDMQEDDLDSEDIDIISGHRQRVKSRFLNNNHNKNTTYDDYELLEMLLFYTIPRRDVKPLAKSLLQKYGNLATIISTPKENLLQNKGVSENTVCLLQLVKASNIQILKKSISNSSVIKNWQNLMDYCFAKIAYEKKEVFHVVYLNVRNTIIADEILMEGSINSITVYPREIIARCLDLRASSVIIIHNHPSGKPDPSSEDIEITNALNQALTSINVKLHDHVIIAMEGITSFKNLGLLR